MVIKKGVYKLPLYLVTPTPRPFCNKGGKVGKFFEHLWYGAENDMISKTGNGKKGAVQRQIYTNEQQSEIRGVTKS